MASDFAKAVGAALSVPRVPGAHQASVDFRRDGYVRLKCLQCPLVVEGHDKGLVTAAWNSHL